MTTQEDKVLEITADLWNAYIKLPVVHPDDMNDVRFHIHAIQNIVMARDNQEAIKKLS